MDTSFPYFVKSCNSCSRQIKFRKETNNKLEVTIKDGEQFVIPPNWLQISANPLKSNGHLTKYGLGWFAELIFIEDLRRNENEIKAILENNDQFCNSYLKNSELLKNLNFDNKQDSEKIYEILEQNKTTSEWWIFLFSIYNSITSKAIEENDSAKAAWAMRFAERCRAMSVFKENLEEVVWMGHSARKIIDAIKIWHSNKSNADEEFWQLRFNENPYLLSQLFSTPIVFIKDKAQIGGMNIDGKNAKYVDYLCSNELSRDAVLVEIKTPKTKLLGKKYRGIYTPSSDITGAEIQVLDYKRDLSKNIRSLIENTEYKIDAFNPKCIVIAGNLSKELDTEQKRKSFELFRTSLKDVEIVTFDELFKKAESLATLFNLTWKSK